MKFNKSILVLIVAFALCIAGCVAGSLALTAFTEFPSQFFTTDGIVMSVILLVFPLVSAVALYLCAVERHVVRWIQDLSYAASSVRGNVCAITFIIYGASMLIPFINAFSSGMDFYAVLSLISAVSVIAMGMFLLAKNKFHPAFCIPAILTIINFIIKAMMYFVSNPLVKNSSQKYLYMCYLIFSAVFWLVFGRLLSGEGKSRTMTGVAVAGYCTAITGAVYCISPLALMISDSSKWMLLTDTADITTIVGTLCIATIVIALTISKDGGND